MGTVAQMKKEEPPKPESLEQKVDRLERTAQSAFDAAYPQGHGR